MFKLIFKSIVDFFKDNGPLFAGAISFFFVMAMVPFCLFLITMFGNLIGEHRELFEFFSTKLVSFFPKITHEIARELEKLITYKGVRIFSLIIYGLISYQLFSSLESATNHIFKIQSRRKFFYSLILSLAVATIIVGFVLASLAASSAISMLKELQAFFPELRISGITAFLIRFAVPFVLVFLVMSTLYKFLPLRKVPYRHALLGGLFMTVFMEAAKHLFTFYVGKVLELGTVYGPLSAFIIFLLWVFYISCIFLIGAEFVHNLGLGPRNKAGKERNKQL